MTSISKQEKEILIKKHIDEGMKYNDAKQLVDAYTVQVQANGKTTRQKTQKKPSESLNSSFKAKFKELKGYKENK